MITQSQTLVQPGTAEWAYIQRLYRTAFPAPELKSFRMIQDQCAAGRGSAFVFKQGDSCLGFGLFMCLPDSVLLDYLAVDDAARGQGVGSKALKDMLSYYSDRKFILEIERVDGQAENQTQRERRRRFYLQNGMLPTGLYTQMNGVDFEILSNRPDVTYQDYESLYKTFYTGYDFDAIRLRDMTPFSN